MLRRAVTRKSQQGLSLVELMVGIAIGMFVVAAASTLIVTQLTDNRRLMLEVQVQQDLRATADIITRELRRAGSIASIGDATSFVWTPGSTWSTDAALSAVTLASGPSSTVTYRSSRTPGSTGPYGFRLQNGAIQSNLGSTTSTSDNWQQLTDPAAVTVTAFTVTSLSEPALVLPCSKLCTGNTQDCWPRVTVRAYSVDITARATSDARVVRSMRSVVRLKNDLVTSDASLGTRSCPA